ncbi:PAAR domain-containing protein [Photobacterium leiognathi]|uniref:PAAR domain-containing protein n=1 Tax=Photobacterium leiognathi TaxID=553611 RepID=UPI0029827D98|nr:PAAR domain-containing protein [Photobacterium leiognathi]
MSANVESRGLIHQGDMTTTGGVVTQGVGNIMFVGCGVTHIGMIATCPSCKKGQGPITPIASIPVLVDGVQAALHGDIVACGCPPGSNTLIASPTAMSFRNESGVVTGHRPFVSTADRNSVYSEVAAMAGGCYESTHQKEPDPQDDWKSVKAQFPLLVFRTKNEMDDFDAPDMTYGNESRDAIESYGLMQPFKNKMRYSPSMGYDVVSEDQFNLPASEHFKRMRSLGNIFSSQLIGQVMGFETSHVFAEMVDKFQRNEGGYFESAELTLAMKSHETTAKFHKEILKCLRDNISDGVLPEDILSVVIKYMNSDIKGEGAPLPQFLITKKYSLPHDDLFNGGVISVHGVWAVEVYVEKLEYLGDEIRGVFRYKIQDHFGLDTKDIDHNNFDDNPKNDGKPFELINGFRSWYLLQHYKKYAYKPFITNMEFKL